MQQGFEACQPFGDVGRLRFEDIRHARNFDKARLDVALFVVVGHDPHTRKTGLKDLALAKRLEFRTNLAFAEGCQDRFLFARRERNTLQVDDVACAVLCEGRECVSDLVQKRRDIARGNFRPDTDRLQHSVRRLAHEAGHSSSRPITRDAISGTAASTSFVNELPQVAHRGWTATIARCAGTASIRRAMSSRSTSPTSCTVSFGFPRKASNSEPK